MTVAVALAALLLAAGTVPAGPQPVCRITDPRLDEISGLAATGTGFVVVNDGSDVAARRRIFFLDRRCAVTRAVAYPSRPRDTEDLALGADGTLWVGDIGDNGRTRSTIALWRLAPGGRTPRLHRLAYPDGPHDAEALLLTPAGTPIVVTKNLGASTLYVPGGPLRAGRTTPLRQAGTVTLPATTTSNPFSLPGRLLITGGAVSPDGRRAVLRTYADAFDFAVPDGDVVRAVTAGTPRVIPLPDEPQGESIAYTADGAALLTVSEVAGQPAGTRPELLRYPLPEPAPAASDPPASDPPAPTPAGTAAPAAAPSPAGDGPRRVLAPAVIAGGVLVAAAAVAGIRARRRRATRGR